MRMLEVITCTVTPLQQNASLLVVGKDTVIIDPGGEDEIIARICEERGLTVTAVWLTHSHLDHCGGVQGILKRYTVPLYGHPGERFLRERVEEITAMYGIPPGIMMNCPEPSHELTGGERLFIGTEEFEVRFVPGHSPGHLCFYHAASGTLIAGDTVFAGSIGRTDLPGGNHRELLESIRREILSLPDDTVVYPGHGPTTTVGIERVQNPFLQGLEPNRGAN